MEDVVEGGLAVFTGRGGGKAEAMAPLTSGKDVVEKVETRPLSEAVGGQLGRGDPRCSSREERGGGAEFWVAEAQE